MAAATQAPGANAAAAIAQSLAADDFLPESTVWPPQLRQGYNQHFARHHPDDDPVPIRHLDQLEVYDERTMALVDVSQLTGSVLMARGLIWNDLNDKQSSALTQRQLLESRLMQQGPHVPLPALILRSRRNILI